MSQRVIILGKRFSALRRDRYLTQEEFAQRLEMSPANVRRLEQSEAGGMQVKNFRRLATLLNVSPDDLRRQIGAPIEMRPESAVEDQPPVTGHFPSSLKISTKHDVMEIPHYHGVSAARTENRSETPRGRAAVPTGSARRFAVTVDGDCMEPKYRHNDTVIFSIDAAEREGIVDGKNYFVQFADGETTFKRIFLDPENRELVVLKCWNDRYPPRIVERAKIQFVARAVFRMVPDE